ncbi:MAG TPA: CoA transferase [Dehalococcoidia bacterium]|nr:CoA transferase [Dehalococcoidia bacterium]
MRVLELSENLAAAYAGMLLADLGCDVIKVESPTGDPWRTKTDDLGDDSLFQYANRRKRSACLDLDAEEGREAFSRLVAGCDAVVEDLGAGAMAARGLGWEALSRLNPGLVLVSIAPFGQAGPRAGWQASELVVQAMGGVVHNTGWDDAPPLKLAGYAAAFVAGINAATAALAAVHGVESGSETGVHIDLSMQEAFAHHWTRHIAQWCYAGTGTRRERREQGRQGFPHTVMTADGLLYILALRAEWEALAFFLGLEQFVTHEFSDPSVRAERWPEIEPHFRESLRTKGRYQWFADAAAQGYTFAPIDDPLAILASPQLEARGYFKPAVVDGREYACPGLPFSFDAGDLRPNQAPRLGEHTQEVLAEAGARVSGLE